MEDGGGKKDVPPDAALLSKLIGNARHKIGYYRTELSFLEELTKDVEDLSAAPVTDTEAIWKAVDELREALGVDYPQRLPDEGSDP